MTEATTTTERAASAVLISPFSHWQMGSTAASAARRLCQAIVVLVPLLEAFRGVDVTDTGFVLTNQQLIFSDPASVSFFFHLWLTNVLGGLLYLAIGSLGLLSFKLAAAAIYWGVVWAAFRLLDGIIHRDLLWLGGALAVSASFADKINILHYDNLSALFFGGGIALLAAGISGRRTTLVCLSGFILTLNTFVRLPNIVGVTFVCFVPMLNWLNSARPAARLPFGPRTLVWFAAGCASALAMVFFAMTALGHFHIYVTSVKDLFLDTRQADHAYSAWKVVSRPFTALPLVLGNGALSLAALGSVALVSVRFRRWPVVAAVLVTVFALTFSPIGDLVVRGDEGKAYFAGVSGAFYLLAAATLVFMPGFVTARFGLAVTLVVATTFALSIGSDTQILPSSYAFPLLMPAGLHILVEWSRAGNTERPLEVQRVLRNVALFGVMVLAVVNRWTLTTQVYRDTPRFEATADIPMIRGVFTSSARADALERTVPELARFIHPGDRVLFWDSVCLFHFLTRTKPYLDNPWPVIFSTPDLEAMFAEKERSSPLPYVVIARQNPRSNIWPAASGEVMGMDVVMRFVNRHGMQEVWSNDVVQVYAADDTDGVGP